MKIRSLSDKLAVEKPLGKEKQRIPIKGAVGKEASPFREELHTAQKRELSEKLKFLLADIDENGQRLIKLRTVDVLTRYKDLIKTFMKEVVQNLYVLKEEKHFDPKGKHKVLILVKSINKSLEDLVKMVLDKQINNLKLLDKIGEIKGMLIDLYS